MWSNSSHLWVHSFRPPFERLMCSTSCVIIVADRERQRHATEFPAEGGSQAKDSTRHKCYPMRQLQVELAFGLPPAGEARSHLLSRVREEGEMIIPC